MLRTLDRARAIITEFENFEPEAYPDPIQGWSLPTIGYGTTRYPNGLAVKKGDRCTREEAESWLENYLIQQAIPVLSKIPSWRLMNRNQKAALTSFGYNLGPHFYRAKNFESITLVCDSPNRWGDGNWIKDQFVKYRNRGTAAEPGLKRRRQMEAALFCTPCEDED